ncbi:hypothetical protein [Ferrimonas balearica]|uniref:hypothetical protein n=1 Tax=Ferrimonas balearica TaxID=44012 RepID=UPI001C990BC6|nr:hypothetical protein [Ferrimonas balearica]MBY5990998.1 hypothetical protein [Ferrimonas balearica]
MSSKDQKHLILLAVLFGISCFFAGLFVSFTYQVESVREEVREGVKEAQARQEAEEQTRQGWEQPATGHKGFRWCCADEE